MTVIEKATGLDRHDLTKQWLTEPLGMSDSKWVARAGRQLNPQGNQFGFATTCRDLAKFGLMMVADGKWGGRTIIENDQYFDSMLKPSQDLNPMYGYLWWLNGMRKRNAAAPEKMVAAKGALGRRLYVLPSEKIVVVRIGGPPAANFDVKLWERLTQVLKLDLPALKSFDLGLGRT